MHWLAYWMGLTNPAGPIYSFWSGIVGDATIFAAALIFLKHKNCHEKTCWRPGHADQHGVVRCRVHKHPDAP